MTERSVALPGLFLSGDRTPGARAPWLPNFALPGLGPAINIVALLVKRGTRLHYTSNDGYSFFSRIRASPVLNRHLTNTRGPILFGTPPGHLHMPLPSQRLEDHEQIRHAVASVLMVVSGFPPGRRRHRRPRLADRRVNGQYMPARRYAPLRHTTLPWMGHPAAGVVADHAYNPPACA